MLDSSNGLQLSSVGLCAKVTVAGTALAATHHHITFEQNREQKAATPATAAF